MHIQLAHPACTSSAGPTFCFAVMGRQRKSGAVKPSIAVVSEAPNPDMDLVGVSQTPLKTEKTRCYGILLVDQRPKHQTLPELSLIRIDNLAKWTSYFSRLAQDLPVQFAFPNW